MEHYCDWEGHTEHEDEKSCFYAAILANVKDRRRLVSIQMIFVILLIIQMIFFIYGSKAKEYNLK